MANVISFKKAKKRKKKMTSVEDYFKYAYHTGLCPKCGKALRVCYTCNRCLTITIICKCGLHIERRKP